MNPCTSHPAYSLSRGAPSPLGYFSIQYRLVWRRVWDSNPGNLSVCRFSRAVPSTARPTLRIVVRRFAGETSQRVEHSTTVRTLCQARIWDLYRNLQETFCQCGAKNVRQNSRTFFAESRETAPYPVFGGCGKTVSPGMQQRRNPRRTAAGKAYGVSLRRSTLIYALLTVKSATFASTVSV